ncbi:MAG TPA: hypothetical protein VMZ04_09870 [Anaerolineae bacterium]|nr:hypothetical protein [Anaerolineae bacterium]
MSVKALYDKKVLQEKKHECFTLSIAKKNDFPDIWGLENVLVKSSNKTITSLQQSTCLILKEKNIECAVCIGRSAYENGEEIPYDGREKYINKIVFLAVSSRCPYEKSCEFLSRALVSIGDKNLILVETDIVEAQKIFENLKFCSISSFNGGTKRYVYSFERKKRKSATEKPQLELTNDEYAARFSEEEKIYHMRLKKSFGFDIINLIQNGFTVYKRNNHTFVFTFITGESKKYNQAAFKIDLYEMDSCAFIGYIDILVPTNCDFALNDSAISDFPSVIPPSLKHYLNGLCTLDTQRAKSIREGWSGRDSLWVRQDFRRAGIGSTLERVAGDVCKLVYPTVKIIGIIFNVDNTKAYLMHIKAGAKKVDDHHYRLEYTLDNKKRPQINILYGI